MARRIDGQDLKHKDREGKDPSAERQIAFRWGLSAESRAAAYLIAKGYRIVAWRWRSPVGQIDYLATFQPEHLRRFARLGFTIRARSSIW